ncbi:MAG TPA: archaetidylserine decarboxylase [Gemmataceae bacterium]|jgi:phosphatidylserine decarboxylase
MKPLSLRTKLEEILQARRIHGGVLNLWVASLGVRLSRVPIPSRHLRLLVFKTLYGKKYPALDEGELEQPLWSFRSLNALFTRGVRPECRPISAAVNQFLCPCDSRVQDMGQLERDRLLTVKGTEYTLNSLLPGLDGGKFEGGHFAILFLSPSDCHRVFSPQEALLEEVIHVPGRRLLVHPPYQKKEYPVFSLNERVILNFSTPLGRCVLVMVAGWGVGHITLLFDRGFRRHRRRITRRTYDDPIAFNKGEWLATFELGSTVILLTEPAEQSIAQVSREDKVKYGQPLFSFGH